jgi:hypothetical protein
MFKRARWAAAPLAAALALVGCGGGAQHATTQTHGGRIHSAQFVQQAKDAKFPAAKFSLAPAFAGYDAVTVSNVPRGAAVIGCYASGPYANCATAHAYYPRARLVSVATWAAAPGRCLDTEPGDATPSQDAGWIRWMISLHVYEPCIYASAYEMGQVKYYLSISGLSRSSYFLWVAAWDGSPSIPPGYDAKQWQSTATLDYDTFAAYFFAPAPPSGPTPAQLAHWRGARNSSFSAYHREKCSLARQGNCKLLGDRVTYFQGKLWTGEPRWACFGKGARTKSDVCWVVRPLANYYSHAYQATVGAYQVNTCDGPEGLPSPVHSRLCDVLRQRRSYFHARATALVKAYG